MKMTDEEIEAADAEVTRLRVSGDERWAQKLIDLMIATGTLVKVDDEHMKLGDRGWAMLEEMGIDTKLTARSNER